MTRVAVIEPFPRVSGVTTYAFHLAEGFRRTGARVDTVSFIADRARKLTVGGQKAVEGGRVRSGWQWSPQVPDRVARWGDAVSVFGEYDLLFLNEPRCAPLDKRAMRKIGGGDIKRGRETVRSLDVEYPDLPEYIRALSESGTPWATCMHDPGYDFRHAPFLPQLMELAPPSLVVTHRDGSLESGAWAWGGALPHLRRDWLPYAFEPAVRTEWPRVAGMLGRYINNKGQPTLMSVALAGGLPPGWRACADGSSPIGAGPNHTFLTFESFLRAGFPGERPGNGNVTTGEPWEVRSPGGSPLARYGGPYDDGVAASAHHGVHVSATEASFSGPGSLEYADLEAAASGALLALPDHRDLRGDYAAVRYELTQCANAEMGAWTEARVRTREQLSRALHLAADVVSDERQRVLWAGWNYDAMRRLNDPRAYAEAILGGALR